MVFKYNHFNKRNMCKKNYVTLRMNKKQHRLFTDDIAAVHTAIRKKRPPVPAYETPTET